MSEPICLDETEVAALRRVLAMLATIGERVDERRMIEISEQMWRHELVIPAQPLLRRFGRLALAGRLEEG